MTDDRPEHVSALIVSDQAAMTMARKYKLVRSDGTLKCLWDGCNGDGRLPSLECLSCCTLRHDRLPYPARRVERSGTNWSTGVAYRSGTDE